MGLLYGERGAGGGWETRTAESYDTLRYVPVPLVISISWKFRMKIG